MADYKLAHRRIIQIQLHYRAKIAKRERRRLFHKKRSEAAFSIQRVFRRYVFAKFCRYSQASTKIQKVWRGFLVFSTYTILYTDIIRVQSLARALIARRLMRAKRAEIWNNAATAIQKAYRGFIARDEFESQCWSALTIQRCWRGHLGRLRLFIAWRAHMNHLNFMATKIQSIWRAYEQQQIHLYTVGSVIQIQSICRMALVMNRGARQQEAAILIQAHQRRFSCRMRILRRLSRFLYAKSKFFEFGSSATAIQCWWRYQKFERRVRKRREAIERKHNAAAVVIASFFMVTKSKAFLAQLKWEKEQDYAATNIQLWCRVKLRLKANKRAKAAQKIYKFLKFVKAEVDREIKAEQKRRKFRNRMRNRTKELDEAMLETAWQKVDVVAQDPTPQGKKERPRRSSSIRSDFSFDDRSLMPTDGSLRGGRSSTRRHRNEDDPPLLPTDGSVRGGRSSSRRHRDEVMIDRDSLDPGYHQQNSSYIVDQRNGMAVSGMPYAHGQPQTLIHHHHPAPHAVQAMPPLAPVQVPVAVQRPNSDYYIIGAADGYEIQKSNYRLPPPRMKTYSRQQIDQDLDLEEAYLDVEISGAKARRMEDKLMKQQRKSVSRSGSRVRSSGSSVRSSKSAKSTKSSRSSSHTRSTSASISDRRRAIFEGTGGSGASVSSRRSTSRSGSTSRPSSAIRSGSTTRSGGSGSRSHHHQNMSSGRSMSHSRYEGRDRHQQEQQSSLQRAVSSSRSISSSSRSKEHRRRDEHQLIHRDSGSVRSSSRDRRRDTAPLKMDDRRRSRGAPSP